MFVRSVAVARRSTVVASFLVSAVLLAACGGDGDTDETIPPPTKTVLSFVKGDAESEFFEEIYAQALENPNGMNLRVARLNPLPTLDDAFQALVDGKIDVLPVYSADLLALLEKRPAPPATTSTNTASAGTATAGSTEGSTAGSTADPAPAAVPGTAPAGSVPGTTPSDVLLPGSVAEQVVTINQLLPEGLTLGQPSSGEHKQGIACTKEAVEKHSLAALSTMSAAAGQLVLGAPAGFATATPLGEARLKEVYDLSFKSVATMADDAAVRAAVKDKSADCFVLDNGSATVVELDLAVIRDDRFVVPGNAVIPVARIASVPDMTLAVIDAVTERVTSTNLTSILGVMAGGISPHSAAKSFLQTAQPDPEPVVLGSDVPGTGVLDTVVLDTVVPDTVVLDTVAPAGDTSTPGASPTTPSPTTPSASTPTTSP